MTKTEFIEFVQNQAFLDEGRKKELIDNIDWLSASDREFLVKQIRETAEVLERNNQAMLAELQKIEDAITSFQKEELPKLAKAQEASEKSAEESEAEQLLKNL